jgi:hypothetical protein
MGDCLPKARRLALGLTLTAAPQLVRSVCASWFEVRVLKEAEYSSILLPFKRFLFSFLTLSTWLKPGVKETQNILVGHFISHDFWRKAL